MAVNRAAEIRIGLERSRVEMLAVAAEWRGLLAEYDVRAMEPSPSVPRR
jgi:hypothetical protein